MICTMTIQKLKWRNLLSDTCPKCGYPLEIKSSLIRCESPEPKCSFNISQERYQDLKVKMTLIQGDQGRTAEKNQELLNNL